MRKRERVSLAVIRRLPRYHRFLGELIEKGVTRISSRELSELMNLTASQIRQDFNCFGGFGQQGYGYNVVSLHEQIGLILGLSGQYQAVLVGVGNLGRTITTHISFPRNGFSLRAVFDKNPMTIGKRIGDHIVRDAAELLDYCRANHPQAAILCVPEEAAEELASQLCAVGVRAFWNFSHYDIALAHPEALVENVRLEDNLMTLCYHIHAREEEE